MVRSSIVSILILSCLTSFAFAQSTKDTSRFIASVHGTVYAMTSSNGVLYVAGSFDSIAGLPFNNIAKWDGAEWTQVGSGIHGDVRVLLYDGMGRLYGGGKFDSAGNIATSNIAYWNGNNWDSLGVGVNDTVFALYLENATLYCGGSFTFAGSLPALRIATWSDLRQWDTLALSFIDGSVRAIGGGWFCSPLVGGTFTMPNRYFNCGSVPGPIYSLTTLYGFAAFAGAEELSSYLTFNTPFVNMNWLKNVTANGNIWGIAPIDSKRLLAWGDFDTLSSVFLPGVGFFDGMQWRNIYNFSAKPVTSGAWFGHDAFFSVQKDSIYSEIFSYLYRDTIIAHFGTYSIQNDSTSNRDLLFQACFGYGGNCYCESCENFGSLTPRNSTSYGISVGIQELAPWSYELSEIDNSTNLYTYEELNFSGGNVNYVHTNTTLASPIVSIVMISDRIILSMNSSTLQPPEVRFFNVLGQCFKTLSIMDGNSVTVPFESLPRGVIFVSVMVNGQMEMRSFFNE
jgi:hypothetical protein